MKRPRPWRWTQGDVRLASDHFELSFGDMRHTGCPCLIQVALVGRSTNRIFPVQWVVNPGTPTGEAQTILAEARRQLDFYLVEHPQQFRELMGDPWSYAIYHCGTAANIYSPVHWSYFPGIAPPRHLNPAKQIGAEEMTMRITTGQKLASSLRYDDYVQIDKDDAKVHRPYRGQDGNTRICRPTLFSVKENRSWRVSADALPGQPCEACDRWR